MTVNGRLSVTVAVMVALVGHNNASVAWLTFDKFVVMRQYLYVLKQRIARFKP